MPAVNTSATVLVTGASGLLGTHVVKALLDQGFRVHGTVRNDKKGEQLKEIFKNHERFHYVLVPDIEVPGAFDEAVKNVDAIIHTATPVTLTSHDPQAVIGPAITGTVGILESTKKYGSTVKRVEITSSVAAVTAKAEGKRTFTDKDWNDTTVQYVEREGANAFPPAIYGASKVLAERAAWDFLAANKDSISFDITTVCPTWIFGPMLTKLETFKDVVSSNEVFFNALRPEKNGEEATKLEGGLVDVRDLGKLSVDLLTQEKAGNERFLASGHEFSWQDVYDALNEHPAIPGAPIGEAGATKVDEYETKYDKTKLESVLGQSRDQIYRPLSETVRDLVTQVKASGVW
ncbi:methylglyoxal reductase (NADPH-dependent) gre2 [Tulasnella sp. 419]|nr:methylglyoxal reductase (NADPH-dependent) gre2 [Tulasnella sp. 418]KAG8948211.1 methylglyoxal reductase (NADPH-dependent) gre2 [Tulasnella sp. 419]